MNRPVYLSFELEDLELAQLFKDQASNASNELEFSDRAVRAGFDSINVDNIKRQIIDKLKQVSANICLIGMTTYTSKWVDWEVRTSASMRKGLLGVRLHSSDVDVPPKALTDYKAQIVDCKMSEIISGIEKAAI
jgi:hypothetical protein